MALISGIFTGNYLGDDENGLPTFDRTVDGDFLTRYIGGLFTDGVASFLEDCFFVEAGEGLTVNIKSGMALVGGKLCYDDNDYTLTLGDADTTYSRYDRVVLRLDVVNRTIEIAILQGVASANPYKPDLTSTTDIIELSLATILRKANETSLTQSQITDDRLNENLCGVISPRYEPIEAETFLAQLQTSFDEWFTDVKETLSDDATGSLLTKINQNIEDIEEVNTIIKNQAVNADIIRVKMAEDIVIYDRQYSLPFAVSFNNGKTVTDWGELQSNGTIKILKAGEYNLRYNFYSSGVNGISVFHVKLRNAVDFSYGENYVYSDRDQCAGNVGGQFHLEVGELVQADVYPSILDRQFRINYANTYLMISPVRFDS